MNMARVKVALEILEVWYSSWEEHKDSKFILGKKSALKWKAKGIICHDRVLNGFNPSFRKIRFQI